MDYKTLYHMEYTSYKRMIVYHSTYKILLRVIKNPKTKSTVETGESQGELHGELLFYSDRISVLQLAMTVYAVHVFNATEPYILNSKIVWNIGYFSHHSGKRADKNNLRKDTFLWLGFRRLWSIRTTKLWGNSLRVS